VSKVLILTDPYNTCKKYILIRINHRNKEENRYFINWHIVFSSSMKEMIAKATFQGCTVALTKNMI